ncbi:MAG TPA: 16S rRNA (guanine(966)-N(2))-methyltransferase RsmD [Desulfurobacteriaceae bacterium]|nr:16S rRNA (guanine(966)-N(2))-methyltransferase RsmD [Desulfurobacteriaceae bacterium]
MKIVGGKYKGKEIKSISKSKDKEGLLRPTMEKVRKAFFDILGDTIVNTYFLDLFAGTGAVGIEALSRGAKKVVFVEKDSKFARLIKENLEKLNIPKEKYEIINMDFKEALEYLAKRGDKFDFIYCDPPYERKYYEEVINLIKKGNLLNKYGILTLEDRKKRPVMQDYKKDVVETREYGATRLMFLNFDDKEEFL